MAIDLSIIIPTFNERQNVARITERINDVLLPLGCSFEILFMDDSTDDTPTVLHELAMRYLFVRFIHRTGKCGLGSAVSEGFQHARGDIFIVMDADLQHPPEIIYDMMAKMDEGYQMVIPSRFIAGGSDGGLNWYRKFVSWTARIIARLALKRLRKITDPTSGLFAIKRSAISGIELNPIGWKIMLEIIIQANIDQIIEIPYKFHARDLGNSKMRAREQVKYLIHLAKLVSRSEEDRRFYCFCLVGISGVIINLASYKLMLMNGTNLVIAFMISTAISILTNYTLNRSFTWRMRREKHSWTDQLFRYSLVSLIGLCLSSSVLLFSHYVMNGSPMASGILGIVSGITWNFIVNDKWTFTDKKTIVPPKDQLVGTVKTNDKS
ncbi:glycosyltransferase [Sporolactobacillus terrae]|uniref:glycosyltransferase n=1 Tax=Sporolactobacillus terrae TaxID=269673 RepID=UPI0011198848|nr:glycosyltransferase family 2 protein [Sporolactobacillus terrae]